jgi:hypothetical protein
MRLLTLSAVVAGTLGLQQLAPAVLADAPTAWAYRLTEGCAWAPRRWSYALGEPLAPRLDRQAEAAQLACWYGRGMASPIPLVKIVLRTWPTEAELAAWNPRQRANEDVRSDDLPSR